jgi:hypothetical protein
MERLLLTIIELLKGVSISRVLAASPLLVRPHPQLPRPLHQPTLTQQQQLIVFPIILGIYRVYVHPLASYPGPKLFALTNLVQIHYVIRGTWVRKVLALHEQYGPVVRVAPDEISYAVPEAWDDIYKASASKGEGQLRKAMPYVNQKIQPKDVSRSRKHWRNIVAWSRWSLCGR